MMTDMMRPTRMSHWHQIMALVNDSTSRADRGCIRAFHSSDAVRGSDRAQGQLDPGGVYTTREPAANAGRWHLRPSILAFSSYVGRYLLKPLRSILPSRKA